MPVTSMTTDPEALTMTLIGDFPVPVGRLWSAFSDPRQLERFWGPPGYPATFGEFALRPEAHVRYRMTSPKGEQFHAEWLITAVEAGRSLTFIDQFTDADGVLAEEMPVIETVLTVESTGTGSRFTLAASFASADDLEQMIEMGMIDGYREVASQLDLVLADLREYALGKGTQTTIIDDTHVRITRGFDAPRHLLWRAHTEPELMKRWLLGPDGWAMTVCDNDLVAGGSYRTAWAPEEGTAGEPFGFEGENLVIDPERRIVATEAMTGAPFPANVNDLTFDEADGVTLLTLLITYPDITQRDMILATGMTDGMESSYARLEAELLSVN
ncbi:hypothetical protein BH09ACT4_BH09ACT4_19830 [soil metagenome]